MTDPINWRAMFAKYIDVVGHHEGVSFLSPPSPNLPSRSTRSGEEIEWTEGEWVAIERLLEEIGYD